MNDLPTKLERVAELAWDMLNCAQSMRIRESQAARKWQQLNAAHRKLEETLRELIDESKQTNRPAAAGNDDRRGDHHGDPGVRANVDRECVDPEQLRFERFFQELDSDLFCIAQLLRKLSRSSAAAAPFDSQAMSEIMRRRAPDSFHSYSTVEHPPVECTSDAGGTQTEL